MVLVYISSNNGIAKSVVETITYARKLSNDVVVITTGAASQDDLAQLGKYGASSVKVDRAIVGGDSQQLSRLISSLALSLSADTVLFSHDVIGKAVAPRVSVQLKAGLVSGAIALPEENGSIKVNVFSGKAMGFVHVKSAVKIISLLPNSIPAELNGANCPVEEINGQRVVCIDDYQNSTSLNRITNEIEPIAIPKSNVLIYYLEDGSKICARPSGTEPKIKFYFSVNTTLDNVENFKAVEAELDQKIKNIIAAMQLN